MVELGVRGPAMGKVVELCLEYIVRIKQSLYLEILDTNSWLYGEETLLYNCLNSIHNIDIFNEVLLYIYV